MTYRDAARACLDKSSEECYQPVEVDIEVFEALQYFLLRLALGTVLGALAFGSAKSDVLEGPLAIAVCKDRVSAGDFEDLRFPLGQVQLILSKRIYCAPPGRLAGPDEAWWTARFIVAGATTAATDDVTLELTGWSPNQVLIHAGTLSIVAVRRAADRSTDEIVKIGVKSDRLVVKEIDTPVPVESNRLRAIPYWGTDSAETSTRSLSPLLGDTVPLRLIDSPWVEIGEGVLLDVRDGATRHYKTEQAIDLERLGVLGIGPDDRTLLSVADAQDPAKIRLVLTDTIEDKIQVIPLDASQLNGPPESITAAWIHRRFDVVAAPGKMLELRARPLRSPAPQRSFASYSDTNIGLESARSTIIPLIVQALERDWDATFRKSEIVNAAGTQEIWFGTVGRASIALSFSKDGSVDLTFLGDKDDKNKESSRAQNAMARATFEAIGQYLNDSLHEPDWQEQLIKP
jgi:hypothetical protein